MPAARQRSLSPFCVLAVMATMIGCATVPASARIRPVASNPSITGMWQSIKTKS